MNDIEKDMELIENWYDFMGSEIRKGLKRAKRHMISCDARKFMEDLVYITEEDMAAYVHLPDPKIPEEYFATKRVVDHFIKEWDRFCKVIPIPQPAEPFPDWVNKYFERE